MTARRDWTEAHQSELPAMEVLSRLGWREVRAEELDAERTGLRDVFLRPRLVRAIRKLNPWISETNVERAVRALTDFPSSSLKEANEKLYVSLTKGISLDQDLGGGTKSRTVSFFDFDDAGNNEFLAVRQLVVHGARETRIPDIVCFVNGIPLAVIECKNPSLGDKWRGKAIGDLHMYQELGDEFRGIGIPKLFETAQVLIGCCGQNAVMGTVGTPAKHFSEWKDPFPATVDDIEKTLGRKPTPQDVLFWGVLSPVNLLDIVRNFVVVDYDRTRGRKIKKVCRYPQFRAVNKAIHRATNARKPEERGGVVWHTQGSGKSLTMLWLCLKLRSDDVRFRNPTLVVVTDRVDLDQQIGDTFVNCGFPNPERADSVRDLRDLLAGTTGKTVLTTIQKFQELLPPEGENGRRRKSGEHPVLSTSENVYVLVDEAHRTQYRSLAANMRQALENACFIGFTGTPIDKNDRSTRDTFGPYIDTYTIVQSVADGATVEIRYESRLPELRVVGATLDTLFDRVFDDRSPEEREAIKDKYASENAVAGAPKRIEAICLDLVEHYANSIRPGGFKAQIVACSRDAAVTYKETLDRLGAPESKVVFSSTKEDSERLLRHRSSEEERAECIKRFLKKGDPLEILIVCDMLITGFDAPVEQVMYLDSPLREHTLLQAIARTNRTDDGKEYGLVVDYWGVTGALEEALEIFAPNDIEGVLRPKSDELPRLQTRHAAALRYLANVRNRNDLDACVEALAADDVRAEFDVAFRRFALSMDMLLPSPLALPYIDDLKWLGKVRQAARARYRDERIDISDCGAKARKLIEEAIVADGVEILVKEVSLFSAEFERKLGRLRSDDARASEMEHAIRHEIHVRLEENPVFFTSLMARLEQIVAALREKRIEAAEALQLMLPIRTDVQRPEQAAKKLGLTATGHAIYGLLKRAALGDAVNELPATWDDRPLDDAYLGLASFLESELGQLTGYMDWHLKDDVQREMRRRVKRALRDHMLKDALERVAAEIVDLLKVRRPA